MTSQKVCWLQRLLMVVYCICVVQYKQKRSDFFMIDRLITSSECTLYCHIYIELYAQRTALYYNTIAIKLSFVVFRTLLSSVFLLHFVFCSLFFTVLVYRCLLLYNCIHCQCRIRTANILFFVSHFRCLFLLFIYFVNPSFDFHLVDATNYDCLNYYQNNHKYLV